MPTLFPHKVNLSIKLHKNISKGKLQKLACQTNLFFFFFYKDNPVDLLYYGLLSEPEWSGDPGLAIYYMAGM